MQDSKISTSMPVLDLIDAIQPGSIKYDLLKTEDLNDEEKLNNAKYVSAEWHLHELPALSLKTALLSFSSGTTSANTSRVSSMKARS